MKYFIGFLFGVAIVLPHAAEAMTLQERVEQRRLIRLGRTVQEVRVSPRRVSSYTDGIVTHVVDGSVFQVRMNSGETQTVRTLGSEAPILQTGSKKQQCFAEKSREKLTALLLGKGVRLIKDDSYRKDNEGRLLRYVRRDTLDINGWMIWNGYAFADKENDYEQKTDYIEREYDSRRYEKGLWGNFCDYHPDPSVQFEILQ